MIRPLEDQEARNQIETVLDCSMIVEAAAGTGKTTMLLKRIVRVLAEGRAQVEEIVALTFTEKAASELKLGLRSRLDQARAATEDPKQRRNLEEAVTDLEKAHISTIHTFCAELLRERPVEAGVDPAFEVMDDVESRRLYSETFGLWLQEKLDDPPEGVRRALRRFSKQGPIEVLRLAGWTLADWRDFPTAWRRDAFARESQIDSLIEGLHGFSDLTCQPKNAGDPFYEDTRRARRLSEDVRLAERLQARDYDGLEAELVRFANDSEGEYKKFREPRQRRGIEYCGGVTRQQVQAAHEQLLAGMESFARAAAADLAAVLHGELKEPFQRYEETKARAGRLDFLDLLLLVRNLIVRRRDVRADFQRRFKHIFIDEFQDTDPLQVDILLLLAASDPEVSAWRKSTPAPGKLFIVGDPKQAIYRFRRADVGLYREVSRWLKEPATRHVKLTTSFRSVPSIQRAVNAAFAPLMNDDEATLQAAYVPLSPFRPEYAEQPALVALPVAKPYGQRELTDSAVEKSLPQTVGAFVSWLLNESHWTVTERELPHNKRTPIRPGHICLLFRRFQGYGEDVTRPYVEALEARAIPHLLVGGKSFHSREEIETMRAALAAIEWPDDELAVFATLRGPLFAFTDIDLLEYRRRYKRLHPFRIPSEPADERLASITEALQLLQSLHRRRNYRPAAETLARLLDATRACAGFALRHSGEQALANVLHIAELARRYDASGGISFRGFVERLEANAEDGEDPEAPILEEGSEGVRIMTLHKAKGLEFPVVILADITCKIARAWADRYLEPERELCAVKIGDWQPSELLEHHEEEVARARAEGVRVAYVAATRARDLLVVPAIGDDPRARNWDRAANWWVAPLYPALYPAAGRRRQPKDTGRFAWFGEDSVVERPRGRRAAEDNVRPGMHGFDSRSSEAEDANGAYEVVWWDPNQLKLKVPRQHGVRRSDLLSAVEEQVIEADLKTYNAWVAQRAELIGRGSQPLLVARTATEVATSKEGEPCATESQSAQPVDVIEIAPDLHRPGGPRYGALVHAVLATVALDADRKQIGECVALQGRILGATEAEVASAGEVVERVLASDLLARARASQGEGLCRRETPVTVRLADGTLVEGVVDLAFLEGTTWIVVDFKTDRELESRLEGYRKQVALYRDAISRATGQEAKAFLVRV